MPPQDPTTKDNSKKPRIVRELSCDNTNLSMHLILAEVAKADTTQATVRKTLNLSASSASNYCRRLAANKLILRSRRVFPADERQIHLVITKKGQAFITEFKEKLSAAYPA